MRMFKIPTRSRYDPNKDELVRNHFQAQESYKSARELFNEASTEEEIDLAIAKVNYAEKEVGYWYRQLTRYEDDNG